MNPTSPRLEQRVYINGFPKSGLHLVEAMVRGISSPVEGMPWLGNIRGAWSGRIIHPDHVRRSLRLVPAGGYVKGHCAYDKRIERALWDRKAAAIFVHRDLRAVAVSATRHILDDKLNDDGQNELIHPGREQWAGASFAEVLDDVIRGVDGYPGVVERWRMFAPWLRVPWVQPISFEDAVGDREATASKILRYVVGMSAAFIGARADLAKGDHDRLIEGMVKLSHGPTTTKREGKAKGWLNHWNESAERAFVESGGLEFADSIERAAA